MLVNQLDYLLNQAHPPQGDGLLNRLGCVFHAARSLSRRRRPFPKERFVGPITLCGSMKNSNRRLQAAVVAQERNTVVLGKKTEHLGHGVE